MHIRAEQGREGTGVEVVLPTPDGSPFCIHGPALLFERFSQGSTEQRRFFACSAYRNRKDCSLYVLQEKPWSAEKVEERRVIFGAERKKRPWYLTSGGRSDHVQKIRSGDISQFCQTCSHFIEEIAGHSDHTVVKTTYKSVTAPSRLLTSLTSAEGNAQYLFSPETTTFLSSLLTSQAPSHVLCLGTPRVKELLGKKPKTMLLDLDDRYLQFYPPTAFQHYNLSSNYFFEEEDGPKYLEKFLKKCTKIALVLDPPFGALARVIAHNLAVLKGKLRELVPGVEITTYWIFPYFLSKHVAEVAPDLKMCHFIVEYDNHPVFKKGNSTRSPVRVFTDQSLKEVTLPVENYKHCASCERDVPRETNHCKKCDGCAPVDRATKHCAPCGKCVREHYVHCAPCEGCRPVPHHCKPPSVCHRCQQPGHKRRFCPLLSSTDAAKEATVVPEAQLENGKKYFTLGDEEKKRQLREERKRKRKEEKAAAKKAKV